ncbi:unnamed protein product [Gongylonema pulchrum]|uniref:Sema domain-containing protein n=1 Tax=Gongylonema pulchrum TaxID=637853 RepID=A0A183DRY4_9BILA|nr:unnamed protein product [Gongylonema pulchrum]
MKEGNIDERRPDLVHLAKNPGTRACSLGLDVMRNQQSQFPYLHLHHPRIRRLLHRHLALPLLPLLLTAILHRTAATVHVSLSPEDIVAEFINPNVHNENLPFEKMVIDPSTGRLYVGGVNNLYDLNHPHLSVKAHATTGPEEDSVECPSDVLYVASTYVQNGGPFRDDVPAVASLSLDQNRLFDVSARGVGTGTEIKMERSVEDDVLYGVFVKGWDVEETIPSSQSALCVYSMATVEKIFLENIELCFKGETSKNLPWFRSTDQCVKTKYAGQEVLCGKDVNNHIGGEIPVKANAALVTRDAQFSAVATNTTRAYTIAFIGTHDGRLLKVL